MENTNKKLMELEYKIKALKRRGKKKVEWILTNTERKFLEEILGEEKLIPIRYQLYTKSFKDLYSIKSSIVKEVHYANKSGKKTIGRPLKKQEMEDLDTYKIKYHPIKFIIYLN